MLFFIHYVSISSQNVKNLLRFKKLISVLISVKVICLYYVVERPEKIDTTT